MTRRFLSVVSPWLTAISLCVYASISMAYDLTISHQGQTHKVAQAELSQIAADQSTLKTITPWTDETNDYQGVPLAVLLDHFQIDAVTATARALNDYKVEINLKQAIEAGAFIASHENGQAMKVRNKGPFWIVFPWTQRPDLVERKIQDWSIWQLTELKLK